MGKSKAPPRCIFSHIHPYIAIYSPQLLLSTLKSLCTVCITGTTAKTSHDNNFTHQAANLGIVLDQFVFNKVFPPLSAELGGWAFNCQFESLFCDRQLLTAALRVAIQLPIGQMPAAPWFQVNANERPFFMGPTLQIYFGNSSVA